MTWFSKIAGLFTAIIIFILSSFLLPDFIQNTFSHSEAGISGFLLFIVILSFSAISGKYFLKWLTRQNKYIKSAIISICCLSGTMLVAFCLFLTLVGIATHDLCAETVISEKYSPNQTLKAKVYQIDCGATTGFNTQVDISWVKNSSFLPIFQNVYGKKSTKVFLAQNGHGQDTFGKHGGPEVRIEWKNNKELDVGYNYHANVKIQNSLVKGVEISFNELISN